MLSGRYRGVRIPACETYNPTGLRGVRSEVTVLIRIYQLLFSSLNKKTILYSVIILLSTIIIYSCSDSANEYKSTNTPSRVISMAPSVTEIIYALSLQNRLVGVSSFCKYPAEVCELPTVGGYINPDYEQILKLKPDLVILLEEHVNVIEFLKKHKIGYLKVDNDSCSAILNSIKSIAQICGERIRGEELVEEIWKKLNKVPSLTKRPKVLICIGRNGVGNGKVEKVYAAGRKSFYNELIVASGGVNACNETDALYPTMSVEGIIRLEPDIIIDCSSSMERISEKSIVKDWESLDMMKAVKTGDVYSLSDNFVTIPGPRIVLIADKFRLIVNCWNDENG